MQPLSIKRRWEIGAGLAVVSVLLALVGTWGALRFPTNRTDLLLAVAGLRRNHMAGANADGAYLPGTDLSGQDLTGVRFRRATLRGADFRSSDLARADFRGAEVSGIQLVNATFDFDTKWPHGYRPAAFGAVLNVSGYDLRKAKLARADLRNAVLAEAVMSGADLRGADLRGADLSHTWLDGADLRGAQLAGAIFDRNTVWPKGVDPRLRGAVYTQ